MIVAIEQITISFILKYCKMQNINMDTLKVRYYEDLLIGFYP
jgi:hypothetical protein